MTRGSGSEVRIVEMEGISSATSSGLVDLELKARDVGFRRSFTIPTQLSITST